jgi:hypothetical protein
VAEDLLTATAKRVADNSEIGGVDLDFDEDVATQAVAPLLTDDVHSFGVVVYPQLGGLHPSPETGEKTVASSVMVVVDQYLSQDDPPDPANAERVRRCIDVRLRVKDDQWQWEGLGDVGGVPVERPNDLPEEAQLVLDHPDIDLPDSARWDIHEGIIDRELLRVMATMADVAPYGVTALKSGHPRNVFAKKYVSNHALGRAVDVWSIDGTPVVQQSARLLGAEDSGHTPAHRMTEAILERTKIGELGSPWDLDGPATADRPRTRSFTNTVHTDHLHVAFDAT